MGFSMEPFQLIKRWVIRIWRRFVRQHQLIVYSRESDGRLGLSLVSWTSPGVPRPTLTQKIVDGPPSPDLRLLPNDFTCQVVWCDKAFIPIEYDLRLMSSVNDVSGIPTGGKSLIIVAAVDHVLHFRIFDSDGQVVVDTDEKKLAGQAGQIEDLRKQLESLWPPYELTK